MVPYLFVCVIPVPVVRMTDRLLDKTEVDSIISVRGIVEIGKIFILQEIFEDIFNKGDMEKLNT